MIDAAARGVCDIARKLHAAGLVPESTVVRRSTLEDVFLKLTGRSLVD